MYFKGMFDRFESEDEGGDSGEGLSTALLLMSSQCAEYCPNSPEVKAYSKCDPKKGIFFFFF